MEVKVEVIKLLILKSVSVEARVGAKITTLNFLSLKKEITLSASELQELTALLKAIEIESAKQHTV